MAINYIYPESDVAGDLESNFQPVGSTTLYGAINSDPYDPADTTYLRSNAYHNRVNVWLGDNGVFPSSVNLTFRSSYTVLTGPTPPAESLPDLTDLQIVGLLYNASNIMFASGSVIDPSLIEVMPMTIYSGINDLDMSDFLDIKLRMDYHSRVDYEIGVPDSFKTTSARIYGVEVAISGYNLPESESMTLFIQGPCNNKGDVQPIGNYLNVSSDYVGSIIVDDTAILLSNPVANGGFDVRSLRFGIPNFGNSFVTESGYVRIEEDAFLVGNNGYSELPPVVGASGNEVAFYGNGPLYYGEEVNYKLIDNLEFWTNYSSGLLRVSGEGFYNNVAFKNYSGGVVRFSGGDWPNVEVRVDLSSKNADFRFIHTNTLADDNYVSFRPTLAPRQNIFISTSGAGVGTWYNYNNNSSMVEGIYASSLIPTRMVNNLVADKLYFTTNSGDLYSLNLKTSGVNNICLDSTISDIDVSYDDSKLYYITPSSLNSISIFGTGIPSLEHAFTTSLKNPRFGIYNSRNMVVSSISGLVYKGSRTDESSPWSFSALPALPAAAQHDVDHKYFHSGYAGALILRDANLYRYNYDNGLVTQIAGAAIPSGVSAMVFEEFNKTVFMAVRPNRIYKYGIVEDSVNTPLNQLLGIGTNQVSDIALRQNKNYINTSSGVYELRDLSKCCNTAPSGFVQIEAGYSDSAYFGYPEARLTVDNEYLWRSVGSDNIRIGAVNTFSTAGYHSYQINEDVNSYTSWRNVSLEFKIHNFKNTTVTSVSPTGYLSVDNVEYRYEDCYTATADGDMDLFMLAGLAAKPTTLYTHSATPSDGEIPLYAQGGIGVETASLYVSGVMRTADDDIPLFILPRDSGNLNEDTVLYIQGGVDTVGDLDLFLFNHPSENMTLFIEGTYADPSSGDMTLFTRSTAEASVYKSATMFIDSVFREDMTLFIDAGIGDNTNNMTMYVGGIQLDAIKAAPMMIYNTREAASGDFDMFIAGPTGSGLDGDMTLYIFNDIDGSGPNITSAIGMTINSVQEVEGSGNSMYIHGVSPTDSGFTLYMPSSVATIDNNISMYTHGF